MQDQGQPELVLDPAVVAFLRSCGPEQQASLRLIMFGLLLDPSVDNVNKFAAAYFPYGDQPVREYFDDDWYVSYVVEPRGDVRVLLVIARSELPPPPGKRAAPA